MKFAVGDHVETLDDALKGRITAINNTTITVLLHDGFTMSFDAKELIKIDTQLNTTINYAQVADKLKDVASNKKFKLKPQKKEKVMPPMEVDLHIHQLTANTKAMTNHDMLTLQLETAKHKIEFAVKNKIQRIVFIHGVGEGVLKMELEYLFGRYNVSYYDADYKKYGFGATEVYVYQNN